MKRQIHFLLILFLVPFEIFSQITFQKTFGGINNESGYYIFQTSDNGYIISGDTAGNAADNNFYLIKLDSNGNINWTRSIGDTSDEKAFCIKQTADAGYIFSGNSFNSNGNFAKLIKTNSSGDLIWSLLAGGTMGARYAISAIQTEDGGYMLGSVDDGLAWNNPYEMIKVDSNGSYLWQSDDMISSTYFSGYGSSLQSTFNKGFIVTGTYEYQMQTQDRIQLSKADSMGQFEWEKFFYGMLQCESNSVWQTADSGFVLGGSTNCFGAGGYDMYIIKTNLYGDSLWAKTYGGSNDESIVAIQQTSDGGYIVIANTNSIGAGLSDIELLKLNQNGDSLWAQTFGGANNDIAFHGAQCSDGGYIIVGSTQSFGNGGNDIYVVKTDSAGNIFTKIKELKNESEIELNPNPATTSVYVHYELHDRACVNISIYDLQGKIASQIPYLEKPAGLYLEQYDLSAVSKGLYMLMLQAGEERVTKRLVVD